MKYNNIFNYLLLLVTFACLFGISSCKDEEFNEITSLEFDRVFSPTQIRAEVINRSGVRVKWAKVNDSVSYTVEISKDSLAFDSIIYKYENYKETSIELSDLDYLTRYSIRIRAISVDSTKTDSKSNAATFKTGGVLQSIIEDEVGSREFTLRWDAGKPVSYIIISNPTMEDLRFDITDQEKADGIKLCEGLQPLTSYSVKIYNNDTLQGSTSVFTIGEVIYDNVDSCLKAITNAKAGDYITLTSDTFIFTSAITITKPITIRGASSTSRPVIRFFTTPTTCINIELNEVGNVKFSGLNINGYLQNNSTRQQYLITPKNDKLAKLTVSNCIVEHIERGFIRVSGSVSTSTLNVVVDNSVFNDVTNSGADFIDFRGFSAKSVMLSNSTLNNSARTRAIIRVDTYVSNVTIDHCTFYNVCGAAGTPVIRNASGSNATVTNNIFVKAQLMPYFLTTTSLGIVKITNNNYTEADLIKTYVDQTNVTEIDPGFADAALGIFTLPAASALRTADQNGKALGDPRWAK